MLKGFFTHEEEFKLTHQEGVNLLQLVALLGIMAGGSRLTAIGTPRWVHHWLTRTLSQEVVWLNPDDDLRDLSTRPLIILVNPTP